MKTVIMNVTRPVSQTVVHAAGATVTIADDLADYYISTGAARWPTIQQTGISLSTTASGNTVLVGASGTLALNGGTSVFSVGTGGDFATIQAAIDAISLLPAFTAYSPTNMPTTIDSWAQDSSVIPCTVSVANDPVLDTWFKVTGDSYYYPLQSANAYGTTGLVSRMNRIEASIVASTGITYYLANVYTILLLDPRYTEALIISADLNIEFVSTVGSVITGTLAGRLITRTTGFKSGQIRFGRGVTVSNYPNGVSVISTASGFDTQNTIRFALLTGASHITTSGDGFSPDAKVGDFYAERVTFAQKGAILLGHHIMLNCQGDFVVKDSIFEVTGGSTLSSNKPDAVFADSVVARGIYVSGLAIDVEDPEGYLDTVIAFGRMGRQSAVGQNIRLSNIRMVQHQANATKLTVFEETGVAPHTLSISDCTITSPGSTAAHRLYSAVASSTSTVTIERSAGGTVGTPASGTLTCRDSVQVRTQSYAATVTPNANAGRTWNITLSGNMTVAAPPNPIAGHVLVLNYAANATPGWQITYDAAFKTSTVPVSTASARASHSFIYNGTNWVQSGGALVWI